MSGIGIASNVGAGYQHDIYQRYAFLRRLVQALTPPTGPAAPPLRILDVGCGPVALTRAFLGPRVEIVRADVDRFDDAEIALIVPGEPLPFPDGAFDVVLALDVLEHVEERQRPALVRECHRVSRSVVLLSHPAGRPDVRQAEQAFAGWARLITGQSIPFLEEHVACGLPDGHAVATWAPEGWHATVIENAPLAPWLVFNIVDFLYAYELGDGAEKQAFNRAVNELTPHLQRGVPHYRDFVCSAVSAATLARLRAAADAERAETVDPVAFATASGEAVVRLRESLRAHLSQALEASGVSAAPVTAISATLTGLLGALVQKDTHIAGLTDRVAFLEGDQVRGLAQQLDALREAIVQKDIHIAGLQERGDVLVTQLEALGGAAQAAQARLTVLEEEREGQTALIARRTESLAEMEQRVAALQQELAGVRRALGLRDATIRGRDEELLSLRAHATSVRRELEAMLASRTWWATASLRSAGQKARVARQRLRSTLPRPVERRLHMATAEHRASQTIAAAGVFDGDFYLRQYPDVAGAKVDPLRHYLRRGAREGRAPNPLFDVAFYTAQRPDLSGTDLLLHYVTEGAAQGLDPHPLFDTSFYFDRHPDVVASGMNPLAHYLKYGGAEGRDPHPDFDSSYYLQMNADVAAAGVNPLVHFLSSGAIERRAPNAHFDTAYYVDTHADVRSTGVNPLVHYVRFGRAEGRGIRERRIGRSTGYTPPQGLLPWFNPLAATISESRTKIPALNILLPRVGTASLSGGPNTALILGCKLAAAGVRVRFVSADLPLDADVGPLLAHIRTLYGAELPPLEFYDGHDRTDAGEYGRHDVFLATAWWTAQEAKYVAQLTRQHRFVYLIQDFEPLLHAASTQYALALETYSLDHVPVINSTLLRDYLIEQKIGRFADPEFARRALVFQPALDRTIFHPRAEATPPARRRLLFYARPQHGLRNLFELGVCALQKVVQENVFDPDEWEFWGMGESFQPIALGPGATLVPAPWRDLAGYAEQMRESDILLSLMLSPHPSYPPLEMAASAGLVVTTTFANKSAAALASLSPNVIGVAPTVEHIASGLAAAAARLADWPARLRGAAIDLPATWNESLDGIVPALLEELALLQGPARERADDAGTAAGLERVRPVFGGWPQDAYDIHRRDAYARRRREYPPHAEPGLVSFLTTVWDTPAVFVEALADSLLTQECGDNFEWILLDNGSTHPDTRAALDRIAADPRVRFSRVEANLGIVGGMRACLERATGRYVAPLDSDDLLAPDTVRVVTHALRTAGYPPLAYTDEDRLEGTRFSLPYLKPDFDPVLFSSSCYIAHLGFIDRERALALGAYTDHGAEGSHDWDTFTRFLIAGHTPLHVPEVLYSWRMHQASTAGNIQSKPFVYDSQRCVLTKLMAGLAPAAPFTLEASPLFDGSPDWWMRRDASRLREVLTVVIGRHGAAREALAGETIVTLDADAGVAGLATLCAQAADAHQLLHVVWGSTRIDDERWLAEATGLFELFPDTAMIGGRLHRDGRVLDAGRYFGLGRGCDAPDRGRTLADSGYFAQVFKPHSVSAVSIDHAILDPAAALAALQALARSTASFAHLGCWLGAAFRRGGRRVIYSPILSAQAARDLTADVGDVEHAAFRQAHLDLMPDARYLSRHVSLRAPYFAPTPAIGRRPAAGEAPPLLDDARQLEADRLARLAVAPVEAAPVSFSVLTSVYHRTPAPLFAETARSLFAQTHGDFEWIVLENGPVSAEVRAVLTEIAQDPRVQVFAVDENAGIQGAMRLCLARARRDFVVPLDADDLLEADALARLATPAAGGADLVFSDEDHLTDDRPHTRFSRPGFDPVLNLESSYIWHLVAFRRVIGEGLGVYGDAGAEFCHDWDTVVRFAEARRPIAHVPHVLYHWRTHAASQSHTETQNPGSLASTRAVVERTLTRTTAPALYEVAEFPLFRGAVEWWLRRKPVGEPSFAVVVPGGTDADLREIEHAPGVSLATAVVAVPGPIETLAAWRALGAGLPRGASRIVLLDRHARPKTQDWVWEATKWFELQPDTAIVSGRLLDERDRVVDAGVGGPGHLPLHRGLQRGDPGAFALALKPQTIDAPANGFLMVDRAFLLDAVAATQRTGVSDSLAEELGRAATAAGRRVVFSPLIEASLRGGDGVSLDGVQATASPLAAGRVPEAPVAPPARLVLLSPSDWQNVGTRPEFYAKANAPGVRAAVLLFGRDDFLGRGLAGAALAATVVLAPTDVDGVLVGTPSAPLPEGDYFVALKDLDADTVLSVSGACLREVKERWPARFQAMLAEQARYGHKRGDHARPRRKDEPLFSITTAVYDVDPPFVVDLADSILGQRYDDFEWVLLDNGSTRADTQQVCRDIAARDPRVRYSRVEDNRHIIGGNHYLLEQARGTYIIPVDGDDVLYLDALRILSLFIAERQQPDLLYTDEQKISLTGAPSDLLWRPSWSSLSTLSTCPASHLMVFKRALALDAGFYSADYARGSHDWDSALRLSTRTSHIVHVPFVLYGWRMHPGSAAFSEASKNYLAESQKAVVREALTRLGLAERFDVTLAHDVLGYYHAVRHPTAGPSVLVHAIVPADDAHDVLATLRSSLAQTRYDDVALRIYVPATVQDHAGLALAASEISAGRVRAEVVSYDRVEALLASLSAPETVERAEVHAFLDPRLVITNPDWLWEAVGTFELDPSTGIVGGCILDPDWRVHHIGYVAGLDGFFATPAHGRDMRFVYGAMGLIRRHVTAVYGSFTAVRREVLRGVGGLKGIDTDDGLHGIELCLRAARQGFKTAYSPRMKATFVGRSANPAGADRALAKRILAEYPEASQPDPYYSRHCVRRADAFGAPIVD